MPSTMQYYYRFDKPWPPIEHYHQPTKLRNTMDNTRQYSELPSTVNSKSRKKRRRFAKTNPSNSVVGASAIAVASSPSTTKTESGGHEGKQAPALGNFPYPTDYNDHFETPARAYEDIFPLLEYILARKQHGRNNSTNIGPQKKDHSCSKAAIVYDPYYCAGRAAVLLRDEFQRQNSRKLSMSVHIQHEKRDFYRDIQQNTIPQFDILVTNPPYSENHKERCLEFAVSQLKKHGRPFFLLMPNYVAMKEYFRKIVLGNSNKNGPSKVHTFYITPSSKHPYEYDHPDGTGHLVSPFASVWFCGLSSTEGKFVTKDVVDAFVKFHSLRAPSPMGTPRIVTTLQELVEIGGVSGARRKNPRQRKKMRNQAIERANSVAIPGSTGQHTAGKKRKPL